MTDAPHVLTWEELCADPSLQDLPYRIELNGLNQIVMSPRYFRHGLFKTKIVGLLTRLLAVGETSVESAVMTADNVKVPDVIWAPHAFVREYAEARAARGTADLRGGAFADQPHRRDRGETGALF